MKSHFRNCCFSVLEIPLEEHLKQLYPDLEIFLDPITFDCGLPERSGSIRRKDDKFKCCLFKVYETPKRNLIFWTHGNLDIDFPMELRRELIL